jgi:hypothetical protein
MMVKLPASSDDDSSVDDDGISEGDVDKDDPDGDEYELAGHFMSSTMHSR